MEIVEFQPSEIKNLVERAKYCRRISVELFNIPNLFIFRRGLERKINSIFFITLSIIWELNNTKEESRLSLSDIYTQLARILYAKSMDYGPESIYEFGYKGSAIRIATKLSRFMNLAGRAVTGHVVDESIEDTLMDILGYIILIKLANKGEL